MLAVYDKASLPRNCAPGLRIPIRRGPGEDRTGTKSICSIGIPSFHQGCYLHSGHHLKASHSELEMAYSIFLLQVKAIKVFLGSMASAQMCSAAVQEDPNRDGVKRGTEAGMAFCAVR